MTLAPYEWPANYIRAIDGDTIEVELDRGFHDRSIKRVRLANIDTPELRSKIETERVRAKEAKEYVHQLLSEHVEGFELRVRTVKTRAGKERQTFGRYVAYIDVPVPPEVHGQSHPVWKTLNGMLLDAGFAVESKW